MGHLKDTQAPAPAPAQTQENIQSNSDRAISRVPLFLADSAKIVRVICLFKLQHLHRGMRMQIRRLGQTHSQCPSLQIHPVSVNCCPLPHTGNTVFKGFSLLGQTLSSTAQVDYFWEDITKFLLQSACRKTFSTNKWQFGRLRGTHLVQTYGRGYQ